MSDYIVCEYCGCKELKSRAERCECGSWYCRFSCLAKGLWKVGIMQYTFDEMDRCMNCGPEKLKRGELTFPGRVIEHQKVEAVVTVAKVVQRRKEKVSENQLSLF